jgi:hypothetical protein
MNRRDVAVVAFKTLALWVIVSAATALVELLITWDVVSAQTTAQMSQVANPSLGRSSCS